MEEDKIESNLYVEDAEDVETLNDSEDYEKAVVFEVKDEWPEELKQQVAQLNEMSAIINAEPSIEEDDDNNDENIDIDSDEESTDSEIDDVDDSVAISEEENETFDNLF